MHLTQPTNYRCAAPAFAGAPRFGLTLNDLGTTRVVPADKVSEIIGDSEEVDITITPVTNKFVIGFYYFKKGLGYLLKKIRPKGKQTNPECNPVPTELKE